jgi:hypothetical protein
VRPPAFHHGTTRYVLSRSTAFGAAFSLLMTAQETAHAAAPNTPSMTGPLVANPNPFSFDAGFLGPVYITGVASGLAFWQDNPAAGDRGERFDLGNGQVIVQNLDGWLQFFADVGAYSQPSLGTPYIPAGDAVRDTFGAVPTAYLKLVPSDKFSIEAGKLPTEIGNENSLTFQNVDIERGLLWNQTPSFTRGVQANYAAGPLTVAVSWNDGYYSDRLNWLTGSLGYAPQGGSDTFTFIGGTNLGHTGYAAFATPKAQNNSAIFDLAYTHTVGPWMVDPYIQISIVPQNEELGFTRSASTFSGAVLASYSITNELSLAGRMEYIAAPGRAGVGAPNLLYGSDSNAWSLTLTPTFQHGIYFARGEVSYVGAGGIAPGDAFGQRLDETSQARVMLETGLIF